MHEHDENLHIKTAIWGQHKHRHTQWDTTQSRKLKNFARKVSFPNTFQK